MNSKQQKKHFDTLVKQMEEVLISKGNDYASADRLSNFKLAGAICQMSPERQCLSLIATKVARLGVLLDGAEPNNESIADSVLDLINYGVLLSMIINEK